MLILAAITSFEELILKFLPVPDKIYFYSRFLTEILLYIAFSLVIFSKLLKRIPLSRTPLDLPIILFVVSAILSTLVNHSPIFGSIVSLRPLLRFIPLFYLTVNLNITFNQARKISRTIIFAGTVQVAIGILQFLSRGALDSLLLPRATDTEIGGVSKTYILVKTGREIGSIYGAAGDTVTYAVFLIVIFILIISKLHTQYFNNLNKDEFTIKKYSKKTRFIARILIGFLFINISLTYVRATLFAVIILGMVHSFKAFGRVRTTIGLSVAMALVIIIFAAIPPQFIGSEKVKQRSVFADITGVFTPEYIRIAKKQRLGALIGIVPTVIFNKPILGYGADLSSTIDELNASKISFLTKVWTEEGFKDVYWVTILAFYGLAGLSSMVWMFWRLYYCAAMIYKVSQEQITKETSLAVTYIAMITVFLLFFNQTIEFRIYSFYLWLLSGLMFSLYFQEKKKTDNFLKEE
jgi:hypothetical protein